MDAHTLIVPAIASAALGGALLVPLRDGKQGRKATVLGRTPLNVHFSDAVGSAADGARPAAETLRPADVPGELNAAAPAPATTLAAQADASRTEPLDHAEAPGARPATEVAPSPSAPDSASDESPSAPMAVRARKDEANAADANAADANAADVDAFSAILAAMQSRQDLHRTPDASIALRIHAGDDDEAAATVVSDPDAHAASAPKRNPIAFGLSAFFAKICGATAPKPEDVGAAEREVVTERSFANEFATLISANVSLSASVLPSGLDGEAVLRTSEAPAGTAADETPIQIPPMEAPTPVIAATAAVMASAPGRSHAADRVVPLTRLPLRATRAIAWPASIVPAQVFASDSERYAFLRTCATAPPPGGDDVLARAFAEETPIGRMLALDALRRSDASEVAIDTFVSALTHGTDEERSIAIDALADAGRREHLARALTDRIDAIAAKAALAFVGTTVRADYRLTLSRYLDDARIETLLAMLAGIVE